jgi:hypothetical protein
MSDEINKNVIHNMKTAEKLFRDGEAKKEYVIKIMRSMLGDRYEDNKFIIDNAIELVIYLSKQKIILDGVQSTGKKCFMLCH